MLPIAKIEAEIIIARSASGKSWLLKRADERLAMALAQAHGVHPAIADILAARGIRSDHLADFLNPTLKQSLPDPAHLLDMEKAVTRIAQAIQQKEKIALWGDYDVDGATSTALLCRYLRAIGVEPLMHIPDRVKDGYGPNTHGMETLKRAGAKLVITLDCGTLAHAPLAYAAELGLDVIIIDHHQGEARKPICAALVNPNRIDESSPHRGLAAVGVAFLVLVALNRHLRLNGFFAARDMPDLKQWLDLVALGTVCDVVPLNGLNRAFVAQGLKVMQHGKNPGIAALLTQAALAERPNAYHLGFILGPRINAGGRVSEADLGVRLLTTDNPEEAAMLAERLGMHNAERQSLEADVLAQAMAQAERQLEERCFVLVAGDGWHEGVIGIVASRLKDRFGKPAIVVTFTGEDGKASARSCAGFDLGAAVIAAVESGILTKGGGHMMAAGFSLKRANLAKLHAHFDGRFNPFKHHLAREKELLLDAMIALSGATCELANHLETMGPFGAGHPSIRLAIRQALNLKPELIKEKHVKMLLIDPLSNARLSAIAFRAVDTPLGELLLNSRGKKLHVAGQLKVNEWQGREMASFIVDDAALAITDEE